MLNNILRYIICFCSWMLASSMSFSQVILETDYTQTSNEKEDMQYHLSNYNRITPIDGFRKPGDPNAKLCIVRPLGGIFKNGKAQLDTDTYRWNGQKFVTNFTTLKKQIDRVYSQGFGVYQIVLDNPSWAFQRESNGNLPGGSYKTSTYGNAQPPKDFNAWANYLKDVMSFLVATYGEEKMLEVQFGVGREIGTSGHWTGSKDQFFRFYELSIEAIHSVLPGAKVGSHFLWGSSNKSWGADFVKWCKTNDVHYDFVGVSYYPFYNRENRTNFDQVYKNDFGVIKDLDAWNKDAKLEIHEFALIKSISSAGNSYSEASKAHQNSFMVGLMKMFYEHDMHHVFLWGDGNNYKPASNELKALVGDSYFKNTKSGTQKSNKNYVNAIFTSNKSRNKFSITAYNYNASPTSNVKEDLNFRASVGYPEGTKYRYRIANFNKSNGSLTWSAWKESTTSEGSGSKSKISLNSELPVFSFLKIQIEIDGISNGIPTVTLTSPSDNQVFDLGQEIVLKASASDPDGDLDKVNFKINDVFYKSDNSAPFENSFTPTEPGEYKIAAKAIDITNASSEDFVTITVRGTNNLPTGNFIDPAKSEFNEGYGELYINFEASDPDEDEITTELFINGKSIREEKKAPFEWGKEGVFPDETLDLGVGSHVLEVVVTDSRGGSQAFQKIIKVTPVLNVSASLKENQTMVFPNPSESGVFHLSVERDWEVYNTKGMKVDSGNEKTIDLSTEANGVYFLKLGSNITQLIFR